MAVSQKRRLGSSEAPFMAYCLPYLAPCAPNQVSLPRALRSTPARTRDHTWSAMAFGWRPPRISTPHSTLTSSARPVRLALPSRARLSSTTMNFGWRDAAGGGSTPAGQTRRRAGRSDRGAWPPRYCGLSSFRSRTTVMSTPRRAGSPKVAERGLRKREARTAVRAQKGTSSVRQRGQKGESVELLAVRPPLLE